MRALLALLLLPFRLLLAALRFLLLLPARRKLPDYAELKLKGTLRWRDLHQRRWALGKRRGGPTLDGIEKELEALSREHAVRGIVVRPHELHATAAKMDALCALLAGYRAKGREVVLYWKHADGKDFALAPAATRILLAPGGPVHLLGHAVALTALRGLLDKAGVKPEFFRIGRWKTAPERFTDKEISEEQRELVGRVLDHHFERLIRNVASRRGGDLAWARKVIDEGPYTSRRALEAGLVDGLAYPDEIPDILQGKVQPLAKILAGRKWRFEWPRLRARPRVAVVPIAGMIKPGKSFRWPGGTQMAGDESVWAAMEKARKDSSVKAVVVSIDSRGGAAPASEIMWRAVKRCAKEKPTVAYVENVAASGGYFAAAGAARIVAAPAALVGSIGVFSGRFDARSLLDRLGVHQEVIHRGAHAGILEPAHSLTDGEREVIRAEIAQIYGEFVDRVAEGRGRAPEEIRSHGEGRVFVASGAPDALVDELGDFRAALAWAAREAKIDPAEAEVRIYEKPGVKPGLGDMFGLARSLAATGPLLLWTDRIDVR